MYFQCIYITVVITDKMLLDKIIQKFATMKMNQEAVMPSIKPKASTKNATLFAIFYL